MPLGKRATKSLIYCFLLSSFILLLIYCVKKVKDIFQPIKKNNDKAIIIVPGIGCSSLHYLGKTNKRYKHGECVFIREDVLRPENFNVNKLRDTLMCLIKCFNNYKLLGCNSDGVPEFDYIGLLENFDGVEERDIELSKYCINTMFKCVINHFEKRYGEETKYKNKVFIFNYDWRRSNEYNGERLYKEIKKYGGGVVLIGFSMGNLVSCKAMKMLYDEKNLDKFVRCFISTFPPFNGSVDSIYFVKKGIFDYKIAETIDKIVPNLSGRLKFLVKNYQSMYELFPTKLFLKRAGGFLVDEKDINLNYLQSLFYLKKDPGINKKLLDNAIKFGDELFIGEKHILDFVKNKYFFLGVGHKSGEKLKIDRFKGDQISKIKVSDGDGTVNLKCSSFPPCKIQEDNIFYVNTTHNEAYFNSNFLIDLSCVVAMHA